MYWMNEIFGLSIPGGLFDLQRGDLHFLCFAVGACEIEVDGKLSVDVSDVAIVLYEHPEGWSVGGHADRCVVNEDEVVGSASEWLSDQEPTNSLSFPSTTPASPASDQPLMLPSRSPFGPWK